MTETLTTFTARPWRYYILHCVTVVFFALLLFAYLTNPDIPQKFEPLIIAAVFAALAAMVTNMILTVTGKMYIPDGELILSSDSIVIKSITILLSDIKRVEIKTSDYAGARLTYWRRRGLTDGSGNRIEVYANDGVHTCKFVIGSYTQRDSVREIIEEWKSNGIGVEAIVF